MEMEDNDYMTTARLSKGYRGLMMNRSTIIVALFESLFVNNLEYNEWHVS